MDTVLIKDCGNEYKLKFTNGKYKDIYINMSSSGRAIEKCRSLYKKIFCVKIFKDYIVLCEK